MSQEKEDYFFRPWENISETKEDGKEVLRLPQNVVDSLVKKQYGIFGHSGVQVCGWTKKSLTNKGVCYKQKFYGIECHSCMEMTPAVMWCQENCSFCWRPMEFMKNVDIDPNKVDSPKEIIDNLMAQRKKLLTGFGGHKEVDWEKFKDAQDPSHYAISLSGEPTMYPKLDEMITYLKSLKKTKSIFIVTNAQIPEFFEKLTPESMPTQLYISLEAPNEELFDKINKSLYKDGWQRLRKSLNIFAKLDTRKVLRFTQIKGLNDKQEYFKGYKEMIDRSNSDFIEIKAYMNIGMANKRHTKDQMPTFLEVSQFAKDLAKYLGNYDYIDIAPNSLIALLRKKDSPYGVFLEKFEND